jgi:acetyl esterase/lipase
MSDAFHTSLLNSAVLNNGNRTVAALPLEAEDLSGMSRHWIQVSTNDIYYSDGACYAEGLREAGVEVRLDVIQGWPHTFWLKAPYLERAVKAESDMIEGLRWLLEDEFQSAKVA